MLPLGHVKHTSDCFYLKLISLKVEFIKQDLILALDHVKQTSDHFLFKTNLAYIQIQKTTSYFSLGLHETHV